MIVLVYFGILSGCDYLKIPGVGTKKAIAVLVDLYNDANLSPANTLELLACTIISRNSKASLQYESLLVDLQMAFTAFRHPVVFCNLTGTYLYANSPNQGESFDAAVVGALPTDHDAALIHTMGLDVEARASAFVPQPIQQVQRVGEALPTELECWMLPGSRPSLLPIDSNLEELHDEFHRQNLPCELDEPALRALVAANHLNVGPDAPLPLVCAALADGKISVQCDLAQLRARATQYGVTVRKPPEKLSAEECKGVLRSREAAATAPDVDSLRQQIARLYALEDTAGYGPPRLKDPLGISLFRHLLLAGRVTITPQEDPSLPIPSTGWVAAGEGLPISMDVVRAWFAPLGEKLSGDFVSKQLKEGYQ